ncbi:selenocysteine-specific translation elongation factor [Lutibacter sp. B2]|nr:selenocysteine-specific translation elongation factor [Lutibacter sp. B2]
MKNVIIGTAGHIDHGKTTLIKALTGADPDRLKEEKKRGITIELGFAQFILPSKRSAGIIDVPGHEKFIKNMLAGVGGIDIVLLVVAADEGFMPQTREHLDILSILDIKKGIIVLTKTDLVDQDWLALVKEDIREEVAGTFLENASIVPVSATKGEGLENLIQLMDKMTEETETKNSNLPVRLPIDRVFTIVGFGTVVTGTQIEGMLNEGDQVTIYPEGIQTRVRSLQVHEVGVKTSYAGQRVAINLANVKKEEIKRGDVLSIEGALKTTMMLDIKLNLLKKSKRMIQNRSRVRLYHGTSEVLCRVVLLDREELNPGESCHAQLRLEEEIVAKRGDHVVIRFYSPMETIGGGIILDSVPFKHKRYKNEIIDHLKIKEQGDIEEIIEETIKKGSNKFETITFFALKTGEEIEKVKNIIEKFINENKVEIFSDNTIVHKLYLQDLKERIINILTLFHKEYPLKGGMGREELRNKITPNLKIKIYDDLINYFTENKILKLENKFIALADFKVRYTEKQKKIKEKLENMYLKNRFSTPSIDEALQEMDDSKECFQVMQSMIDRNELIKINEDIIFHMENYQDAIKQILDHIKQNGSITLSQCRDSLQTTRKYVLPLLEFLDQNKITKRVGEVRVLKE